MDPAQRRVQLIITALGLGGLNQTEYTRAADNIAGPIELLLERGADVIVQAGVPPVVTRGCGFAEELAVRVATLTPRPFITDAGASIQAMQALGLTRIVQVGNAFSPELVGRVRSYFGSAGIEVLEAEQVPVPAGTHSGNLPLETVYRVAKALHQRHEGKADGIWLTQAAVPSVGIIDALERDLGVPVVASAQAMMWPACGWRGWMGLP